MRKPPPTALLAGLRSNLNDSRSNLNDSITRGDAIDTLAQHLITRPVFDALFENYAFAEHNPASRAMQKMLETLDEQDLATENDTLAKFNASVRALASEPCRRGS